MGSPRRGVLYTGEICDLQLKSPFISETVRDSPNGYLLITQSMCVDSNEFERLEAKSQTFAQELCNKLRSHCLTYKATNLLCDAGGESRVSNRGSPPLLNGRCSSLLRVVVSEMTYTVSSGTLNSSIPYHTIPRPIVRGGPQRPPDFWTPTV